MTDSSLSRNMIQGRKELIPTGPGKCQLCPRYQGVRSICIPGYGPRNPILVVIAEAPATTEDTWCRVCQKPFGKRCEILSHMIGQPLVGQSGVLLKKIIREVEIDPDQVFYTNVVRCAGGTPTMLQVRKCAGAYLLDELAGLDYSRCRGVMLLGETALRGVLNNGRLTLKESRLRVLDAYGPTNPLEGAATQAQTPLLGSLGGSRIDSEEVGNTQIVALLQPQRSQRLLIPVPLRGTFHPAAALPRRNPGLYDEIVGDFKDLLGPPRTPFNKPVSCRSPAELHRVFGRPEAVGLDLEWDPENPGRITTIAVSDGTTTSRIESVECLLAWLESCV